ncbi:hypothetical protein C6668_06800 [Escherichia coli]|nr:hypothetical protein C6668_06800 [Escherichia coli]PAB63999.1 hypothetical protein CDH55_21560 [Escherichia coli]RLW72142.1 hypothetical protein EAI71_22705 [Escherichia coli]RQN64276.1 hypothetical protein C3441_24090 [Escherichia coli]BDO99833.1 hypothetical protein TUM9868_17030 [Escherichia coli]
MFLASLLRRIAFSYYDYKAYNFNIEKTEFVVIHIPDQIGGNDSNLLIVFYVQIMPDDFVMQLHRF